MERATILVDLKQILEEVLEEEGLEISETTSAKDIEDWDSIAHVEIIVAVEEHFNAKFRNDEIVQFKNIGDIMNAIEKQLN